MTEGGAGGSGSETGARAPVPSNAGGQPPSSDGSKNKKRMNPLLLLLLISFGLFFVFASVSGLVFMKSGARTAASSRYSKKDALIGVVEIKGVIMDSKKTLEQLQEFEEDDAIKAVVLRINSPGGAVAPSQEIYESVKRFPKPIVASMGSVAASGGFYVAMGAKKVLANPGTITGSIGVIMQFLNLKKLMEWAKVEPYVIKTGKFKDVGAANRDMTPEERALLQAMADDVLSQFKQAVSEGRGVKLEQVSAIADGRIFSGRQALELKMVDALGTIDDALKEAAAMAKVSGKPKAVYPERKRGKLIEWLMSEASDDDEARYEGASMISRVLRAVIRESGLSTADSRGRLESFSGGEAPGVFYLWHGPRF